MKKLYATLMALVLLLNLGAAAVFAQDSELPPNGLASLEYRINGGDWTAVPDFTPNEAENAYIVALPREESVLEATVEIRATPYNTTDWIYYYPESKTVTLHNGKVDSWINLEVFKEGQDYEFGKGILTQVLLEVPAISPTKEDLAVHLQTGKSGKFTLGEEITLYPDEWVSFSISGTGMDNDAPLPQDIRLVPTGFTIDGEFLSSAYSWDEYNYTGGFPTNKLSAGEHELEISFRAERYEEIWSDDPVTPDTPPQYGWHEYGEIEEPISVKGLFTIKALSQYTLTVINGGGGTGYPGAIFYPAYNPAPEGMVFDKWVLSEGSAGALSGSVENGFIFQLGEGDATLTATYKKIATDPDPVDPDPVDPDPVDPDPVDPDPTDPDPSDPAPADPDPADPAPSDPDSPKTGDDASLGLFAALAAGSLASIILLKRKSRAA